MLDLRRLSLLRELHARGTIAAVADAMRLTPSAVSQQLAVLERETGVRLLEPAGRGVRLTDPAIVLVRHAEELLQRAEAAEAELAGVSGSVGGRGRIASFQSAALQLAVPAIRALARDAPDLRCELIEAEPEEALPALALGDVDLVLGDEWPSAPHARPAGVERRELHRDFVRIVLAVDHPISLRHPKEVPLAAVARETWTAGHPGTPWEAMVNRTCRELGGYEPDVRHRTNDAVVSLALIAAGEAVTLLPDLVFRQPHPGVAVRAIADAVVERRIFVATRAADARRPSVQALLAAVDAAAAALD